jgi:hypothetical protein
MIFMGKKTKTGPLSQRGFGVTSRDFNRDFKSFNSDIADEIKVDCNSFRNDGGAKESTNVDS